MKRWIGCLRKEMSDIGVSDELTEKRVEKRHSTPNIMMLILKLTEH
jgi:hypothetical protein